ncbi:hypothetical protein GCM10027064_19450 [Microbacterium petrolearium]|jgi:transposase InsO family protein
MTYPLVSELADAGIPVTVSCRVLKLARQPYYRWRNDPVRDADVLRAYRINALHDAHHDDPMFGYRYLADEARRAGWRMSRRTAWKLCSQAGILSSAQRRRRGKGKKAGPPVFDDHVQRVFRADAPNRLWLTDITEHWTSEGKLYCCAIKDVFSNRIVGYSISDRMTAKLAVDAVRNAVARRGEVAGCITPIGAASFAAARWSASYAVTTWSDRWDESAPPATTRPWRASGHCCKRTFSTSSGGRPGRSCDSPSSFGSSGSITASAPRTPSAA